MTVEIEITRVDRARQAARKVARNARDRNEWRKIFKFRLWMPVALQVLLIVALLAYTESRFDGFINEANTTTVLLLAMPLALAAIAQTNVILVGYLDLSVGAMISFGVVVGSFLIGADASTFGILKGVAVILACGLGLGLVNAVLIRGLKMPSLIATLATLSILDGISLTMRPTAPGRDQRRPGVVAPHERRADPDRVHRHRRRRRRARPVAARLGIRSRAARGGLRRARREARRHQDQLDPGTGAPALGVFGATAALFVMARSPIGNAQIGSSFALNSITAAVLGGAALAGGRATFIGSTVASVCSASSSPPSRSSDCHPPTAR